MEYNIIQGSVDMTTYANIVRVTMEEGLGGLYIILYKD